MDQAKLLKTLNDITKYGFNNRFSAMEIIIDKHCEYANDVTIVQSPNHIDKYQFIAYSLKDVMPKHFFIPDAIAEIIKIINIKECCIEEFKRLQKTHFRMNRIFDLITLSKIVAIYQLLELAYDDWTGNFFIQTDKINYVLLWDYYD